MNSRALILSPLFLSFIAFGQVNSLDRGLEFFRQEKYEAALEQFRDARRLQPANASIENFIGITETKLGRIDEANKDYEAASTLDPKLAGPHTNLGFNYLSRKQYLPAEKQLRTALALDGTDTFAHYYLAVLYLTTGRGKDAIPHVEPAAALLENDTAAAMLAIKACLSSNSPAEATGRPS
jgi:Flp pilus assembly protein TadD